MSQMDNSMTWQNTASRVQQFYRLTKPRVVSLIVFTAFIGMFLAVPGAVPLDALFLVRWVLLWWLAQLQP